MDATTLTVLGGIVTAVVAATGAYLAAVRKLSGKINTSEAAELWGESKSIREDYREQLAGADRRTVALEERVAELERRNNELALINSQLRAELDHL